jgi:DNA-binding transcriptional LysR family regulator
MPDLDTDLDANLVLALHALLQARSVSRAAERVGVGQPAMSHALKRLRERFDDPLLVRGDGRLMQLTPRALELADLAQQGAEAIARVFAEPAAFDPATSTRRFRVASSDAMNLNLLPGLLARLAQQAPGVDLELPITGPNVAVALDDGRLDLAIGRWDVAPLGLRRRRLYRERLVSVVRADHPQVGETLDLPTFLALPHMLVAPRGTPRGVIDEALERLGHQRRIAVVLQSFLAAMIVVAGSDHVLTLPLRAVQRLQGKLALRVLTPPLELPGFELHQVWHERDHHDPAHRWLRSLVASVLQADDEP